MGRLGPAVGVARPRSGGDRWHEFCWRKTTTTCAASWCKALQNAGYEVISFDNGRRAYERLREEPFTLLLTDIVMPEMDGIELARRATELDPDLKVMFITGFAAVALNPGFQRAQGRQGPVEAVPSARSRQRGREDAGGLRPDPSAFGTLRR